MPTVFCYRRTCTGYKAWQQHVGSGSQAALDAERWARIRTRAYETVDALMMTDAPLLYTPGQLALAATLGSCSEVRARREACPGRTALCSEH